MLHAINAGKASLEKVLGEEAVRHPREDLITSALFGTLDFLTPAARRTALRLLTGWNGNGEPEIYLWPQFKIDGHRVEPDVLVLERTAEAAQRFWIVEVKWGAPLGDEQISREIRAVRNGFPLRRLPTSLPSKNRTVSGYTLLGAEKSHTGAFQSATRLAENAGINLRSDTWKSVRERLSSINSDDYSLNQWIEVTHQFLSETSKGAGLGRWPALIGVPPSAIMYSI
ncbi:hypothetical protein ACRC7T_13340 [Segnochrobactraceae bacterium EtOH-i3]